MPATTEIDIGVRVVVVTLPRLACCPPRPGTIYRRIYGPRFKWYVWLDGADRATGPYEDREIWPRVGT